MAENHIAKNQVMISQEKKEVNKCKGSPIRQNSIVHNSVETIKVITAIYEGLPEGDMHLNANNVRITSNEKDPLSTKSPLNRYGFSSEGNPLSSKIFRRS